MALSRDNTFIIHTLHNTCAPVVFRCTTIYYAKRRRSNSSRERIFVPYREFSFRRERKEQFANSRGHPLRTISPLAKSRLIATSSLHSASRNRSDHVRLPPSPVCLLALPLFLSYSLSFFLLLLFSLPLFLSYSLSFFLLLFFLLSLFLAPTLFRSLSFSLFYSLLFPFRSSSFSLSLFFSLSLSLFSIRSRSLSLPLFFSLSLSLSVFTPSTVLSPLILSFYTSCIFHSLHLFIRVSLFFCSSLCLKSAIRTVGMIDQ